MALSNLVSDTMYYHYYRDPKQQWKDTAGLSNIWNREDRELHRKQLQQKYNPHNRKYSQQLKEKSGYVSMEIGIGIATGLAMADGPLPVGDTIAAAGFIVYGAWALFS